MKCLPCGGHLNNCDSCRYAPSKGWCVLGILIQLCWTTGYCVLCYLIGHVVVSWCWPRLRKLTETWPDSLPGRVAGLTALFMFMVITHMERGHLDPHGSLFITLYALTCLSFSLSTVHPKQYNAGTAKVEIAFVVMLLSRLLLKI